MQLPSAADGPLGTALAQLYTLSSGLLAHTFAGTLAVGPLSWPLPSSGRLSAVEFQLGTAGGAPTVLDVVINGASATGGAGITIAAGETDVLIDSFASAVLDGDVDISVLAADGTAADLTVFFTVGPY